MEKNFEIRDCKEGSWGWFDYEYHDKYAKLCGGMATLVYITLCRHADKNQTCYPSIKRIAETNSISKRTVITAIQKLEKYNIIRKKKIRKGGKWLNNSYTLLNKSQFKKQAEKVKKPGANNDIHQVQLTTKNKPPSATDDQNQVQQVHTNNNNTLTPTPKGVVVKAKETSSNLKKKMGGGCPLSKKNAISKDESKSKNLGVRAEEKVELKSLADFHSLAADVVPPEKSFEVFWEVYPKKVDKENALRSWVGINPSGELLKKILDALELQKKSKEWEKEEGKYVPYPSKWILGKRWNDEIMVANLNDGWT